MPPPAVPEPAHAEVDSMLSRKFGKEIANYFAGVLSDIAADLVRADLIRVSTEPSIISTDR